jgi:hypothetical protein
LVDLPLWTAINTLDVDKFIIFLYFVNKPISL